MFFTRASRLSTEAADLRGDMEAPPGLAMATSLGPELGPKSGAASVWGPRLSAWLCRVGPLGPKGRYGRTPMETDSPSPSRGVGTGRPVTSLVFSGVRGPIVPGLERVVMPSAEAEGHQTRRPDPTGEPSRRAVDSDPLDRFVPGPCPPSQWRHPWHARAARTAAYSSA